MAVFLILFPNKRVEIGAEGVQNLQRLVERERPYGGDPLRRLAALLPADPAMAELVGARLKLSNAQRKRLKSAAEPGEAGPARALAHAIAISDGRQARNQLARQCHARARARARKEQLRNTG